MPDGARVDLVRLQEQLSGAQFAPNLAMFACDDCTGPFIDDSGAHPERLCARHKRTMDVIGKAVEKGPPKGRTTLIASES